MTPVDNHPDVIEESPITVEGSLGQLKVSVGPDNLSVANGSQSIKLTFAQLDFLNKIKQKFQNING